MEDYGTPRPQGTSEETAIDDHRQRPALTLHIGTMKTGTSSIQAFCARNRARLAEAGWLYPRSPGRTRHAAFGLWLLPDEELEAAYRRGRPGTRAFADAGELRRELVGRLLGEAEQASAQRVLLSDEALYGCSDPALLRLRELVDEVFSQVTVVCYLRRQDDLLISHYQQVVKSGATRTLADRLAGHDLSATFDYHSRLTRWQQLVRPDRLVLRRFEPDRFPHGSLYDDFVAAAGLGIATDDTPPRPRNESLDAESVELLRLLNLYRRESGDHGSDLPANRALVPDLARVGNGPVLTVSEAELDRFMALWEDSNARVARDLLGEPDGRLFGEPRRPAATTSEQRLDPARLDHLLAALPRLPARVADPLRRIAQHEAEREADRPRPGS